eukprot:1834330-Pleurochrysis_carterae.AAC.1
MKRARFRLRRGHIVVSDATRGSAGDTAGSTPKATCPARSTAAPCASCRATTCARPNASKAPRGRHGRTGLPARLPSRPRHCPLSVFKLFGAFVHGRRSSQRRRAHQAESASARAARLPRVQPRRSLRGCL